MEILQNLLEEAINDGFKYNLDDLERIFRDALTVPTEITELRMRVEELEEDNRNLKTQIEWIQDRNR